MVITYLIGNGFDLNLGMKTGYPDFYNYYTKIKSENKLIQDLKQSIELNENYYWSDLELALGKYTQKLSSLSELDLILDDLSNELLIYLKSEEDKLILENIDKNKFIDYTKNPENLLPLGERNDLKKYKIDLRLSRINFITYNYTNVLEKITDKVIFGENFYLNNLIHLHGNINHEILLGINDLSQLENEAFKSNIDIINRFIKPKYNEVIINELIDQKAKDCINNADYIVLFGLSLGDTDKIWWEIIAKKLLIYRNTQLLIFQYEKLEKQLGYSYIHRRKEEYKKAFLSQTSLSETEQESVKNQIHIGYNTDMFHII